MRNFLLIDLRYQYSSDQNNIYIDCNRIKGSRD